MLVDKNKVFWFLVVIVFSLSSTVMAKNEKKKEPAQEKQQKLVKMSTLGSVEANQEFQRNVKIMQAQRRRVIELKSQLKQAQTKDLKKTLQKELDLATEQLNENNKKMIETYGFSLNRNYVLVVEKAHVYMSVTDEEAKKIEQDKGKKKK